MGDRPPKPQGRRRPRRKGRATKDAERRALAKANATPARPVPPVRPGFAVLHVDGGARGAPGPAAIGYVVDDAAGVRLAHHAEAIGIATAAEAEYRALLAGLTHAHRLGLARVSARSDSRLLIAHVSGERHIRSPRLIALAAEIADRGMRIGTVLFEWVPAAANTEAHQLVAHVMESARVGPPPTERAPGSSERRG
ncbi:MAG: ribonuclease HI family protein [Solirubrobacteraceae bacterium]